MHSTPLSLSLAYLLLQFSSLSAICKRFLWTTAATVATFPSTLPSMKCHRKFCNFLIRNSLSLGQVDGRLECHAPQLTGRRRRRRQSGVSGMVKSGNCRFVSHWQAHKCNLAIMEIARGIASNSNSNINNNSCNYATLATPQQQQFMLPHTWGPTYGA